MSEDRTESGLKVVDAHDLPEDLRAILRPGEMIRDDLGRRHRLPRYFYEVPSYEAAREVRLTPHFRLNEFIRVDLREAPRVQEYPRYVPCAIRILAFYLQMVRDRLGLSMHISVNGGYRSPGHERNVAASPHMWGTAVDIYRVGRDILHTEELINRFARATEEIADELTASVYGHVPPATDDHLHLELGYLLFVPREMSEDRMEMPQERPRFAWEERRARDRRSTDEPR